MNIELSPAESKIVRRALMDLNKNISATVYMASGDPAGNGYAPQDLKILDEIMGSATNVINRIMDAKS